MIQIYKTHLNRLILSALIVAGLFLPASKSYAQESFQSAFREIAGRISSFLAFKKNSELAPEERLRHEVQARKEAIQKIFDLTKLEQADLLSRLSGLKDLNNQQNKMRAALVELVKENNNGLKEIQSRLDGAETVEDMKILAGDFKDWRTLVYNPKTEKVVTFTFVFQGKNILAVANERLENVKADLADHQNSLEEADGKAEKIFRKAEADIKEAEELNGQARNLIMIALNNSLSPAKNPHKDLPKGEKSAEKEIARDISDSKAFTEKAMQYVRSAYAEFLELGKIITYAN